MTDNYRYKIIRYSQKAKPRVIRSGLTLEDAKKVCQDPKTHGKGWFYGFTRDS